MADFVDIWAAQGRKNIFGTTVKVCEMRSEAVRPARFTVSSGHRR